MAEGQACRGAGGQAGKRAGKQAGKQGGQARWAGAHENPHQRDGIGSYHQAVLCAQALWQNLPFRSSKQATKATCQPRNDSTGAAQCGGA